MQLDRIDHIAIIVENLAQAKDFYVNKLGFEIIREEHRDNKQDVMLDVRNGNIQLEIFVKANAPKRPSYPEASGLRHLAFKVEDVVSCVNELKTIGIECEPIRTDDFTGEKMTFFFDPDGLPLELHE